MAQGNPNLRQVLQRDFDELRSLRDEVRLKIHLGGMEAKEAFDQIETGFFKLENEIGEQKTEMLQASRAMVEKLKGALIELRSKI